MEAELVYQRGLPPKATYTFKHALVQDTAYQSLLESQRRELHGRIADALEKHFPERVAREPEVIARHCDAAGRTAQAIGHYQRAGERASQASANEEAIGQLRRALELLGTLPETRERDRQELGLQMAIGGPLGAARGWAHPECEGAFDRARALASQIGEVPERARVLAGLASSSTARVTSLLSSELASAGPGSRRARGRHVRPPLGPLCRGRRALLPGGVLAVSPPPGTGHRSLRLRSSMRPLRTRWGGTWASFPAPWQPGVTFSSAIPTGGWR